MGPLLLEGSTLGQRHQHYNQLLKNITTSKAEPAKIDYSKTDIENLFNIDIACNNHDLEYILDVLKCQDLLYISRAIKQSTWLLTDAQYSHIINPEYLHSQLFPLMMPKASRKLLLHTRLTLKDESRVKGFFRYFSAKDFDTAVKWLPNCPISFIKVVVKKHPMAIPPEIFGRLCRRTPEILEILVNAASEQSQCHRITKHLAAALFLLRSNTEFYLDALEIMDGDDMPVFKEKYTEIVMKKCPERIINNYHKYSYCVHIDTFAKCLKKEEIKSFIFNILKNEDLRQGFGQGKLSQFIKHMAKEEKIKFLKELINKKLSIEPDDEVDEFMSQCFLFDGPNTYWYKQAPFEMAFPEIKKLIRAESNTEERNTMLMILVENAGKKLTHIHALLQYYRERHINEPFRFKIQFVNHLLQKTNPHQYNDKIWSILDELFRSMEVYAAGSENNVQTCIKAIITYKVIHDESVPAVIEQKFDFDFMKSYAHKLKGAQKDKLFGYLFNLFSKRLDDILISHQTEFKDYITFLKKGLDLLNVWKKELIDHPKLINAIKECVRIKEEKGYSTSLAPLYDIKTTWKRMVFEDSIILSPSQAVCINALKHDPELLIRRKDEVDSLRFNESICMKKVLRKLRVYWPHTIANEWTETYREQLDKTHEHKALVRGLCCLLNQRELLDFLKKYEPRESKINWVDADESQLSLRKNIAKIMHIARPQVSSEAVLRYAKGDYVQFTQPALNSILYNLSLSDSRECILKLLNGTVSLQKCGIHLAFAKLPTSDMKIMFEEVWKTTQNSSVRAVLFQNTHEVLCKEHDEKLVAEVWELMRTFIDSLSAEENKVIYSTFGKVAKVHDSIKPAYCMKSYKFIKSLPPKVDCRKIIRKIKRNLHDIIEQLNCDFIADVIEDITNELISNTEDTQDINILTAYLLCADDESTQTERFNKVFVPLMNKALDAWDKVTDNELLVKQMFAEVIDYLNRSIEYSFVKNKAKPVTLYRNILKKLESNLPVTQNMVLFRRLELAATFIDILDKKISGSTPITEESELRDLYLTCIDDVTAAIMQHLKEDVDKYDALIYLPFAKALDKIFKNFNIEISTKLKYLKHMLGQKDFVPVYLVVIEMLPSYNYDESVKEDINGIISLIQAHPSTGVQINYYMKFGTRQL